MSDNAYRHFGYGQLLNLKDVRDLLGVSYDFVFMLIRNGDLRAISLNGRAARASEVDETTRSLRFYPSDVRDFLQHAELS